ncbi:MAG: TRL-like family protein [Leptospiraceae bacterium]|nr:TRL-like family protein [Leptospiraceae bacterium]
MTNKIYLLLMFCIINCTGLNTSLTYGFSNTNPTSGYANELATRLHGGFFYHNNTIPGQLGNADLDHKGTSCQHSILYLASWGDSSIEAAKKNNGITKVGAIDYEQKGILAGYLYHSFCTSVYGTQGTISVSKEIEKDVIAPVKTPAKKGK